MERSLKLSLKYHPQKFLFTDIEDILAYTIENLDSSESLARWILKLKNGKYVYFLVTLGYRDEWRSPLFVVSALYASTALEAVSQEFNSEFSDSWKPFWDVSEIEMPEILIKLGSEEVYGNINVFRELFKQVVSKG